VKQPCKECIIGPICKSSCDRLTKYVVKSSTPKQEYGTCITCGEGKIHIMFTGPKTSVICCPKCRYTAIVW
jgi:hypothetical protein